MDYAGFIGTFNDPRLGPVLVMEKMQENLRQFLDRWKRNIRLLKQLRISLEIIRGVAYLHQQTPPLIHRDLNDKNVMFSFEGVVKIGDFGQSKLKKDLYLTSGQPGMVTFMPPEALDVDESKYNESLDIFSVGVLMLEIGTQQEPLVNLCGIGTIREVERRARDLQVLGEDHPLRQLVLLCLKDNPNERPKASDLQRDVLAMVDGEVEAPANELRYTQAEVTRRDAIIRQLEEKCEQLEAQFGIQLYNNYRSAFVTQFKSADPDSTEGSLRGAKAPSEPLSDKVGSPPPRATPEPPVRSQHVTPALAPVAANHSPSPAPRPHPVMVAAPPVVHEQPKPTMDDHPPPEQHIVLSRPPMSPTSSQAAAVPHTVEPPQQLKPTPPSAASTHFNPPAPTVQQIQPPQKQPSMKRAPPPTAPKPQELAAQPPENKKRPPPPPQRINSHLSPIKQTQDTSLVPPQSNGNVSADVRERISSSSLPKEVCEASPMVHNAGGPHVVPVPAKPKPQLPTPTAPSVQAPLPPATPPRHRQPAEVPFPPAKHQYPNPNATPQQILAASQTEWFHGKINRDEAQKRILNLGQYNGVFLVRESTTVNGCYVLTMYAYGTFKNFQIQKVTEGMGVEKYFIDDGPQFPSLELLLAYYHSNTDRMPCALSRFVPRSQFSFV